MDRPFPPDPTDWPAAEPSRAAEPSLVTAVLARLEALMGLAPGDVARRRLERHPALVARAAPRTPDIDDPAWAAVIDAVTVQETRLFRHPAQCLTLDAEVLPALIAAAQGRGAQRLRLLSAGCATGEEAWTLAALAQDAIAHSRARQGCEVLGLDLSRPALRIAAGAQYPAGPPDPLRDVPPAFRHFFVADAGGVAAGPLLRGHARFRRANLLDPRLGDARFDVVSCRNVGIYLTAKARAAVIRRLAAHLHPGGALMLGAGDPVPPDAGLVPWSRGSVALYRRAGAEAAA